MAEDFKPHLFVKQIHTSQEYKVPPRAIKSQNKIPERNRQNHGAKIFNDLTSAWNGYDQELNNRRQQNLPVKDGEYLTFKSASEYNLNVKSLDSSGAQLLNVKYDQNSKQELATIYIPSEKKDKLIGKVQRYSNVGIERRFNEDLVSKIDSVSRSTIENLWSSPLEYMPKEDAIWCELWLSTDSKSFDEIKGEFVNLCDLFNVEIVDDYIFFPERTISIIKANFDQLNELIKSFKYVAELRKPQELNSFWLNQKLIEREDWLKSAINNVTFNNSDNYISILDTGVNNGHILIAPVLDDNDKLTVDQNWGTSDTGQHGTRMAGVAIYGDLNDTLENYDEIIINHKIESVKVIPQNNENETGKLPIITKNAVSIAIINNPNIKRIFCFAITGKFLFDFGKPSTWSATIDSLTFGEDEEDKKIFIISGGNVRQEDGYTDYPENNFNLQIESPAQSWNAISVGAYTEKTLPDSSTLANINELSPFSRTSNSWENNWPIKPDVVFEGGNLIRLDNENINFDDNLEILTTSSNAVINQLTTINATSAATAFASNFMAKLRHAYSDAWEETLRGLMIHSASWTEAMENQLNFNGSQASIIKMLRTFGYGVPNLEKAISCKTNYLTFVSEQIIQPYIKKDGESSRTNEVHFYEFPWPEKTLQALGNLDVTIRVTLSYFIEPNPGEKGYTNNYSYQSVGLRFALMPPNDTPENFMLRINNAAREQLKEDLGIGKKERLPEGEIESVNNIKWALGADNVFKGSIHSNFWKTSAAEASASKYIAIYPIASGWWKNLNKQEKFNERLRYSLIVSIETPENTQDIYTEIAQRVKVENLVKV
ncbi:hypothetical protein AWE51_16415 [Aquimarina aggregata]|uniref:Peptidase S8/S53 domain-containing protein n=1 Tax=Aquimarina aggregata TaxID=1642818 RepID=A0A163D221_9FLAO|nr:S8 family peptidase [Aquimarina aggregata]KZS42935.1 hypothetical protein AWE51_16415 [Aquimarina aggregata]